MYFFLNVTIKSPERPCWCHSVFIDSSNYALQIYYYWLWRRHCIICLEQNSNRKHPKDFEASGFPYCILNNTHFFWNSHGNKKNCMISQEKWGRQQTKWYMQKVPFYDQDDVYEQQNSICRRYCLLQGLCVPSVRTTTYVCKTHQKRIA